MAKEQRTESGTDQAGHEDEVAQYEKELAGYLQKRIKPGLNSGAIPLLARSIAKDIAHREHPNGGSKDADVEAEPSAEAADESSAEAEDEATAEADEATAEADEPTAEAEDEATAEADEPTAEAEDEASAEADEEAGEPDDDGSATSEAAPDFEADMHELQAELGEDWILRFSVQGDDGWLTAEKDDGTQRVEAPTASVLLEAVELLNDRGGRAA
jgi:hypothetical protein